MANVKTNAIEAGNGFGLHSDQLDQDHKVLAFKVYRATTKIEQRARRKRHNSYKQQYFFAAQILYKVATCLTKSSLGMLYLRIFPGHRFRIAVISVVGVTVAYTFAAVLLTVFACKPIEKAWRKTLPGVCVNSISIWYCKSGNQQEEPDGFSFSWYPGHIADG